MAQQLFEVGLGLSVDGLASVKPYNGAPADDQPLGSLGLDYTNGKLYVKVAAGSGADKWHSTESEVVHTATANNGTVTVDSVLVDSYDAVQWLVVAKIGANVRKLVVSATHNGTSLADATSADHDVSSRLRIGNIAGFAVDVNLNGATTAQVMRLQVTTTETTDVTVKAVRVPI